MKSKFLRFNFISLAVCILCVFALIYFNQARGDENGVNEAQGNDSKLSANNQVETEQIVDNSEQKSAVSNIPAQIPILMYHHIREYSSEEDKIGTNLSVSPSSFSNQLDKIKDLGYTAITFEDIANENIPTKPIILTFDDGYHNFIDYALPELKKREMKAVLYVISNYLGKESYVSKEEIKILSRNNIEIGAHTKSHPDLTKISPENAALEIGESKEIIEQTIGKNIISFCYPAGKFNPDIESAVEKAGFKYGVTTKNGIATTNEPFSLSRYRINKDTNPIGYLK